MMIFLPMSDVKLYVLQLRGGLIDEIKVPVHESTWRSKKEGVYAVVALHSFYYYVLLIFRLSVQLTYYQKNEHLAIDHGETSATCIFIIQSWALIRFGIQLKLGWIRNII